MTLVLISRKCCTQIDITKMEKHYLRNNKVKSRPQLTKTNNMIMKSTIKKIFEADIENDELTFSYKLREGVAQNMNACFLMQKMGLDIS